MITMRTLIYQHHDSRSKRYEKANRAPRKGCCNFVFMPCHNRTNRSLLLQQPLIMKQEFEMTREEMTDILGINKHRMPVIKIGNVTTGMDLQERVNAYWIGLSDKYGFKQMTVEPSSKGELFFLAEPKPIFIAKSMVQIEIDRYIGDSKGYLNHNVVGSLKKIVDQLEKCNYETEVGCLNMNVAFLALKQLSNS
jgi:hypothetical protein